jgi:hypothetical protein
LKISATGVFPVSSGGDTESLPSTATTAARWLLQKKIPANAKDTSIEEHTNISKNNINNVNQIIQTKEMTKEVLYSMTKRLKFTLDINDNDCIDKNNNSYYLCLTIPIQKKNESEEEDEFKDEDINEMIQNDANILEDNLKRHFPNNSNIQKSIINTSTNNICDILNKSGDERERKDSNDSFLSIHKKETNTNKKTSNNNTKNFKKKISDNNIHSESQKKIVLLSNKDNNFLNKCLKNSENKNFDKDFKEKGKVRHKSQQYLKIPNVKQDIQHRSDKNVLYKKISKNYAKENKNKNLKFSGVFTKINNFGCSEELDCNDMSISNNNIEESQNKEEIIKSNNNHNILLKTKNLNNQINLELCSGNQNSTNFLSSIHGIKNSKLKSGYNISDIIIGGENHNKNINININNHNIINIINDKNISEYSLHDIKKYLKIMLKKIKIKI